MKPQISVIVPIYNAERHLRRCVKSILTQTFADIEVILVNDGSKDRSWDLCEEFALQDKRVRIFTKENGGASSARRYGVSEAKGLFVSFVDADDTLPNTALASLHQYSLSKNLDIAQGARRFMPLATGKEEVSHFCQEESFGRLTYIEKLFNGYCHAGPWGTLYRRYLFTPETFNLEEDIRVGEDFCMNLSLGIQANQIGLCNHIVYNYIENTNSITHNYQFHSLLPQIHQAERIELLLKEAELFESFATVYYRFVISNMASACFHNKHLIHDNYLDQLVNEVEKYEMDRLSRFLLLMFKHPNLYFFFYIANKLRQMVYKLMIL